MRKIQFAILVYISSVCFARDISEQYKRLTENTSNGRGFAHNDMRKNTAESWQPSMSQRNWIILNSETKKESSSATATEPTAALAPSHQHNKPAYSQIHQRLLKTKPNQEHKENHGHHSHQLPINYYTYNHSSDGNYMPPTAADVKLIEPYIVTISKMSARKGSDSESESNSNAVLMRRVTQDVVADAHVDADASTTLINAVTLPKDIVGNLVSPQKEGKQYIESNVDNGKKSNHVESNVQTVISTLNGNNDETESFFDKIVNDGAHLNEIFLPMRHTLNKVIYFCDMAKRFIAYDDDEDDDDDDDNYKQNENANDNDNDSEDGPTNNNLSPGRVQGHHSLSPKPTMLSLVTSASTGRSQTTTTQETTVGTGRKLKKLKKKLSKFILPLLLAYKLKFLALIPALIGGLILLVGSTGLAGFFFALFTAVMSLKNVGSSKSIIVKKIL